MDKRDENLPKRSTVIDTLLSKWLPETKMECIDVQDALDRILAEDVVSSLDIPVVRASGGDGVGVISSMFQDGIPDTTGWELGKECVRADTGDDFDDKYDAVVMIEQVTIDDGRILFDSDLVVKPGMGVRLKGSSIRKGELLAKQYTKLTPSDLAALAAGGAAKVRVIKKPIVSFIPTGSELIPVGTTPERGQIIDSNSVLVQSMLHQMGAEPLCFPIAKDDMSLLDKTLDEALDRSDIVILNGGSSKGNEDFNAKLLAQKGEVLFHWIAAAPGMPMCIALINEKPVINIPGPSIAAYFGMDWCVRATVHKILKQPMIAKKTIKAKLVEEISVPNSVEILCKMEIWKTDNGYETRQAPFMASTVIENLIAPGQYITKFGIGEYKVGEMLDVELLRDENAI